MLGENKKHMSLVKLRWCFVRYEFGFLSFKLSSIILLKEEISHIGEQIFCQLMLETCSNLISKTFSNPN